MIVGLIICCCGIGALFYFKMIQFLLSSKVKSSYPPVKVQRERARAMGGIGTIFLLFGFILYMFK